MTEELYKALGKAIDRLWELVLTDEDLRGHARAMAEAVLKATDHHGEEHVQAAIAVEPSGSLIAGTDADEQTQISEPMPKHEPARAEPPPPRPPLPKLTLGSTPVHASTPPAYTQDHREDGEDLKIIEARLRLKAEGMRWAITRRRLIEEEADFRVEIAPRDRDILDRARSLPHCYLWMNTPDFPVISASDLEDTACCFEVVADVINFVGRLVVDMEGNRSFLERALDLLAAAQSALRTAVINIEGPRDSDQYAVYNWLRKIAGDEQIYIRRHMRLDDQADPSQCPDIEERLAAIEKAFQETRERAKGRKSRINRFRYHAKRIKDGHGTEHDWEKIMSCIEEMLDDGVPPSNPDIRELLLPILEQMPDLNPLPEGVLLVLREIDRYLASRVLRTEERTDSPPSAEISEVARLLRDSSVVLIGGERRIDAERHLKDAFQLKEVVWVGTRGHESTSLFESYVARPDVALVLLAIRFSSHSFGDVKIFCDRYGKPLVRLPGGYNPNQVAAQILNQCSDQLERTSFDREA